MTEPCHCDLATENAKLRGEVERLRKALEDAADALRDAAYGMQNSDSLGDVVYYGVPRAIQAEEKARAALNPAPEGEVKA